MSNVGRRIVDGLGATFRELSDLATGKKTIHDTLEDVCAAPQGGDVQACTRSATCAKADGHEGGCTPVSLVRDAGRKTLGSKEEGGGTP